MEDKDKMEKEARPIQEIRLEREESRKLHPLERSEEEVNREEATKKIAAEISGRPEGWRGWIPRFRSRQQVAAAAGGLASGVLSAASTVPNETQPPEARSVETAMHGTATAEDALAKEFSLSGAAGGQLETAANQEVVPDQIQGLPEATLTATEVASLTSANPEDPLVTPEPNSELSQMINLLNSKTGEGVSLQLNIQATPEGQTNVIPYLLVEGETGTIDGLPHPQGSIYFMTGNAEGVPSFGYLEPVDTEFGRSRPSLSPMSQELYDYVQEQFGEQNVVIPAVGQFVGSTVAGSEDDLVTVTLATFTVDGMPVALTLSTPDRRAPATPEPRRARIEVAGRGEYQVGQSFRMENLEQNVEVDFVSDRMVFLEPEDMGRNALNYPIEGIDFLATTEQGDAVWNIYFAALYQGYIQRGILTEDGRSYADVLGVDPSASLAQIEQAIAGMEGNLPRVYYKYRFAYGANNDPQYREGYADPNLPVEVVPLPRALTPGMSGNPPQYIEIPYYQEEGAIIGFAYGVTVDQNTGQIRYYFADGRDDQGENESHWDASFMMGLYMSYNLFMGEPPLRWPGDIPSNPWTGWMSEELAAFGYVEGQDYHPIIQIHVPGETTAAKPEAESLARIIPTERNKDKVVLGDEAKESLMKFLKSR